MNCCQSDLTCDGADPDENPCDLDLDFYGCATREDLEEA